jgi:hypothetical protein
MRNVLPRSLALGLVIGIVGFTAYFFAFGQTFDGEVRLSAVADEPDMIGDVTFQSRFRNRRFLTHSVYLDLYADTPTTYRGESINAHEAVDRFNDMTIDARVGYREEKAGWGYVVSLDMEPPGSSPKEILLVTSFVLIFGCTAGMAVIAKNE